MAGLWRRMLHEERGNALPEMVVLLPVYLLLIAGALYRGDLGLIQQRAEMAARYQAWRPPGAADPQGFFGVFRGQATQLSGTPRDETYSLLTTAQFMSLSGERVFDGQHPETPWLISAILKDELGGGDPGWQRSEATTVEFRYASYTRDSGNVMQLPDASVTRTQKTVLPTGRHRELGPGDDSGHKVEERLFAQFLTLDVRYGLDTPFGQYQWSHEMPETPSRLGAWERDYAAELFVPGIW